MTTVCLITSLLVLGYSAYTDINEGNVYSWITLPVIGAGLIFQLFFLSPVDYLIRLIFILGTYYLYQHLFGGGDAKLFMLMMILNGPKHTLLTLTLSCILIVLYYLIKSPDMVMGAMNSIRKTKSIQRDDSPRIPLAPFFLVAFIILALIPGLH